MRARIKGIAFSKPWAPFSGSAGSGQVFIRVLGIIPEDYLPFSEKNL
jgi:hypothetical protein